MIKSITITIEQQGPEEFDFTIDSESTDENPVLKHEVLWALKQASYIIISNANDTPHHING